MNNCNKCNKFEIPNCGCNDKIDCGCSKKIDLKCTEYKGVTLDPLHIVEGMNGEEIIQIINDYLKDLIIELQPEPTILDNAGNGFEIYKGFSLDRKHEIKTLLEGEGIVITEFENELVVSIDPDFIKTDIIIENVGIGEGIFKNFENNAYEFKKLKSSDNSASISTVDNNESVDISINFPVIESEDIGGGTSLRKDLAGKKIGIRTLRSDDFLVTEQEDGSVKISSPGGGANSNDYYLDANFTRPSNWNIKAEEIDGIKTAKGTLNDPFKSYEEYLRRVIGETGGGNPNEYSRVNPKNPGRVLQLLSNLSTSLELEVNDSVIYLRNNVTLSYTGTEEYAISTERLWEAMPKTAGVLDRSVYYEIRGEGTIVNKYNVGVACHKTSITSTTVDIKSRLAITPNNSGLIFVEDIASSTYTLMTKEDNITPYLHGGVQASGTIKSATTPLIRVKGKNKTDWGVNIVGTDLILLTNTQGFLEITEAGSLTCSLNNLKYLINSKYFAYEKKLYQGLAGMTTNEIEVLGTKPLFFKPYSTRNAFRVSTGSTLRIERLSTAADSKTEVALNSIFKLEDNSNIDNIISFSENSGGSAVSYIESLGIGNSIIINNARQLSNIDYFIKGDNNAVNVFFISSEINPVRIIKKDVSFLNLDTKGTFSTIKSTSINTGIVQYLDNITATTAGLITGMLYFNTTENAITQVI